MYKIGDIIPVYVTGIESYGIFVKTNNDYTGLVHISEVDNGFIKDLNKYVKINDLIYVNIIGIDEELKHLKLSIKNINYNDNNYGKREIKENISGFLPLANALDGMIEETMKNLLDNKRND